MGATILIAEDEPFIVESLNFLLSREGHTVVSVSDGGEVFDRLRKQKPDLLILDVMMPTTNGFDILHRIRTSPDLKALPVLALTAKGQEADRRRMLDLGASAFMTKPFSNKELVANVSDLLSDGPDGPDSDK